MHREFIQKLICLVEANLENEKFGPEELAREAGMSHSNLNRKLNTISNQNASLFIREVRLKKAKELLQNEDATVAEISYRVGFGSPTYFNKCFHEYFGYAPGELRNHEQEIAEKVEPKKRIIESNIKLRKKIRIFTVFIIVLLLILSGFWYKNQKFRTYWSFTGILEHADRCYKEGNYHEAFNILQKAGKSVYRNEDILNLDSLISTYQSIYSDPPGVKVYCKEYSDTIANWKFLGFTPINSIKVPVLTVFKYKMIKPDYDTIIAAEPTAWNFARKLFRSGTTPPGMVHVVILGNDSTDNYFIDKFEVTNAEYKKFIAAGGYQNKKYWKYPFVKDKKQLTWEEAILLLTDKTGRPGPSTWQAGDYPPNEEDYPVSGICWYEAAAYAEFAGKELPTTTHWMNAKGLITFEACLHINSNFNGKSAAKVGYYKGMNAFGTFDMAGNVREWCFNGNSVFRTTCGGAWNESSYAYRDVNIVKSFDRSEKNGFRCVKYIEREKIPLACFDTIKFAPSQTDFSYKEKMVSDDVFQVVKNQFIYTKTPFDARIESTDSSNKDYTLEKITFNTVYDDKRMIVYLCLPKISKPPYQTVIIYGIDWFSPGPSYALIKNKISGLDFFLKDGRALLFPVFYGGMERIKDFEVPDNPHDVGINIINDFRRSIDYLETRDDFDTEKIAVLGQSWGGYMSSLVPAIEDRLKVSIIYVSGLVIFNQELTEWSHVNFVTRTKIPTLMLNGKYDVYYDFNSSVKPMFDLLGTPLKDKRLMVYDTDHFVPYNDFVKESLGWLDKYLGPVNKQLVNNLDKN